MLIAQFRQNRPIVLLLLPFILAALWPGAAPKVVDAFAGMAPGMPLFGPVRNVLAMAPWVTIVLGALLVIALAFQLTVVANNADLFARRNHLPALLLPLLLALFPQGLLPDPALVGMFFVLWGMVNVWNSQGRTNSLGHLFDTGLLIGIAGLFYLPYTFLVVVVWASLAVMRPFHWREYVLPALGMAVMVLMAWGFFHTVLPGTWDPRSSLISMNGGPWPLAHGHWMYRVVLVVVLLCFLLAAFFSFAGVYRRSIMREQNIRSSFLAFVFALLLLAAFAWLLDGRVPPVLLAMPAAVLLSYPLLMAKRTGWSEAGVWCLLLLAAWARWMG